MPIFGDGRHVRDYTYVADVARATVAALGVPLPQPVVAISVGTGVPTKVAQLEQRVRALALAERARRGEGAPLPPAVWAPPRPGDVRYSVLDARRAQELLGWQPQASLADGLARTVAWFAAHGIGR